MSIPARLITVNLQKDKDKKRHKKTKKDKKRHKKTKKDKKRQRHKKTKKDIKRQKRQRHKKTKKTWTYMDVTKRGRLVVAQ